MYNCPNCTAPLDNTEGRDVVFCNYCGTRIDLKEIRSARQAEEKQDSNAEAESKKTVQSREIGLDRQKEIRKKNEEKDFRRMRNHWLLSVAALIIGGLITAAFDDVGRVFLWSPLLGIFAVIDFIVGTFYFIVRYAIMCFKNWK